MHASLAPSPARRFWLNAFCPITFAAAGLMAAEGVGKKPERSLADLSIEELMNETVTSVSKREQRRGDAAAAITVLSNDELRRSGATNLADVLRLVPGMDVGSINANQWAISTRGFQLLYANKLLVLVDGRAAYSPLFSGVYWDVLQPMLEDVDRVEVIRGPGATVWGANAVNGVINVVSKSARDTQGGHLFGAVGDVQRAQAGLRYGGKAGANTYYRVHAGYQSIDAYPRASGPVGGDNWSTRQAGVRLDHYPDATTHLTAQTELTDVELDDHTSDAYDYNALARWTRTSADRSSVEIQAYYDRTFRNEILRSRSWFDTLDLSAQHTFSLGTRHALIWGAGYRFAHAKVEQTMSFASVIDGTLDLHLFSAFVQDEITLVPDRLTLTVGTKLEHHTFTGFEVQPSVRAVFKASPRQTWWAAVSRAVRTPSALEGHNLFAITQNPIVVGGVPYFVTLRGNPDAKSESLLSWELGWRYQPGKRVGLDVAVFANDYNDLSDTQLTGRLFPGTGPFPGTGRAEQLFVNTASGEAYGGEMVLTVAATEQLRLTASYSLLLLRTHDQALGSLVDAEKASPTQQAVLRASYDFTQRASLDAAVRYVDNVDRVPAYLTADLRLSWRPTDRVELALVGRNLLDPQHAEQPPPPGPPLPLSEMPRSVYGKVTWRF